jgi:hypothetical protein
MGTAGQASSGTQVAHRERGRLTGLASGVRLVLYEVALTLVLRGSREVFSGKTSGARGLWGFAWGVFWHRRSKWLRRLAFNFARTTGVPYRSLQNSEFCPARLEKRSGIAGRFMRAGVQNSRSFASGIGVRRK